MYYVLDSFQYFLYKLEVCDGWSTKKIKLYELKFWYLRWTFVWVRAKILIFALNFRMSSYRIANNITVNKMCFPIYSKSLSVNEKRSKTEAATGDFQEIYRKTFGRSPFFKKSCSPLPVTLFKKEILTLAFSCEFCKIFKNTYFIEHL